MAGLVEGGRAGRAAADVPSAQPSADGGPGVTPMWTGSAEVKPSARTAARFLVCLYDERGVGGAAGQAGPSGSLTVDLMVRREAYRRPDRRPAPWPTARSWASTRCMWRQRANDGDGWERMPDRGGDTANHRDHVRISFERSAPDGDPLARRCR